MTVRTTRRTVGTLAAAAVTGTLLAPATQASAAPSHSSKTVRHDITFIAMLLPHHEQAVRIASVAAERATRADVRRLAAHIAEEQSHQIRQMRAWLQRRDARPKPPPEPVQEMNRQDLRMLRDARGAEVDRMFLMMMRPHHAQGVSESEDELMHGRDPFALGLARTSKRDQSREIAAMNDMLAALG
ncbi:MAG TPA: DUF305 domain-containing protein [Mycobacterium sp.]|nr:DUF305 domain-containing protein [Mycobacterium sp.]